MRHFAMKRHGNGVVVTFFDGHAEAVAARDLWGLKWNRNFDTGYASRINLFARYAWIN